MSRERSGSQTAAERKRQRCRARRSASMRWRLYEDKTFYRVHSKTMSQDDVSAAADCVSYLVSLQQRSVVLLVPTVLRVCDCVYGCDATRGRRHRVHHSTTNDNLSSVYSSAHPLFHIDTSHLLTVSYRPIIKKIVGITYSATTELNVELSYCAINGAKLL